MVGKPVIGGAFVPASRRVCGRMHFSNRDRPMKLTNQVAIITGAGRNIGEAIAKTLAAEGARVAVLDLDKGRGDKVAAEIIRAGGEAAAFVADAAAEADIVRVVAAVIGRWGRIDILINNAAISDNKNILDITKEQWDAVIAVTLTGPFLMSQHVARQMVVQGSGGKIVNVGSTSGFFGRSRAVAYSAAKGGVANLTRAMAVQLAPHNIRVNGVVPNKIGSPVGRDEFDPSRPVVNLIGRPGMPLDMARAVLFLVSDDSPFIAGNMLFVDGGVSAMMVGDKSA
jgi:NAD(P)-dependent dehydrogenase (short-subunit alcohol dehydrogenase family)